MEEWRKLADKAQRTLLPIGDGTRTSDFLWLVDAAYTKLSTRVDISCRTLMGATDLELDAIPRPPPHGLSPADLIQRARTALEQLRGDHAMAGNIFVLYRLYGTNLGLLQGGPLWQAWEGHHDIAIQSAEGALQVLNDAAVAWQASVDSYAMATSFPPTSPARVAWISEGGRLARAAASGVNLAAGKVLVMRVSVLREYVATVNVLTL
ncbi:hypothetical protein BAE44_0026258 [Dichanthelium oligosanthes]|uniref:Uncharacterized protein n=1 Tax=Dichanthelium oligosanthes TaxID=888268 RepID=A0A1E5UIM5_9POAL|nr:hypothetical protein BAE44_0026258 [Dichanthelium oligosanthes]